MIKASKKAEKRRNLQLFSFNQLNEGIKKRT